MKKLDLIRILQIQELRQEYIKVVQKKKGNGNRFILTRYLFPIENREKKVKKKKIKRIQSFF